MYLELTILSSKKAEKAVEDIRSIVANGSARPAEKVSLAESGRPRAGKSRSKGR